MNCSEGLEAVSMAPRPSNGGCVGCCRRRFENTEPGGQQRGTREDTEDWRSATRVDKEKDA